MNLTIILKHMLRKRKKISCAMHSCDTRVWLGRGNHGSSRASVIIMVFARAVLKEVVLWALLRQAFTKLLLADLELVLWSRRVVAL